MTTQYDSTGHELVKISVPAARMDNLVITESADEVLVYDTDRHQIHHLNHTSAVIWRLCDGQRTVSTLAREAGVDVQVAQLAVAKLHDANLLEGEMSPALAISSQSRRKLLKRAAVAGAGATIVSISAPLAASADSLCLAECTLNYVPCCSLGDARLIGITACVNVDLEGSIDLAIAACLILGGIGV